MSDRPRRAAQNPVAPIRVVRRMGRWLGALAVLVVLAVAPWLVPWQQLFGHEPPPRAATPIEVATRSRTPARMPTTPVSSSPAAPDAGDVARVVSEIADVAAGRDLPVSAEEVADVDTRPGPYRQLGRLAVPAIGVDVGYGEGVFADTLEHGPGHWPGTPMPGRPGNAVISGHRNTHTQPFKRLDELAVGDAVIATDLDGRQTRFRITRTTIVPEAEYKEFVLAQPADQSRQITLFACHPEGNPVFRIVVNAVAE